MSELSFDLFPACFNILFLAFFLEPVSYFCPCRTRLCNFQPVTARSFISRRGSENFYNLARFDLIVKRFYLSVNLCADHLVADSRVNCIRKINNGCAHRQIYNVASRCKDIYLFGHKVALYRSDYFFNIIGVFLLFEKLSYPDKTLFKFRLAR